MQAYRREYERATRGYNGQFSGVTPLSEEPGGGLQPGVLVKRIIHKYDDEPQHQSSRRGRSASQKSRPQSSGGGGGGGGGATSPIQRYHRNDYRSPVSAAMQKPAQGRKLRAGFKLLFFSIFNQSLNIFHCAIVNILDCQHIHSPLPSRTGMPTTTPSPPFLRVHTAASASGDPSPRDPGTAPPHTRK
jgi:hypothetical protein